MVALYHNWQPHLTVAVVVAHPHHPEQFLYVEEQSSNGAVISQPSGHVELGEDIIAAAVRETLEETAYQVKITDFISLQHWQKPTARAQKAQVFFRLVFAGEIIGSEARALDEGIIQTLWLDKNALLARKAKWRSPLVVDAVEDYLAGKLLPISCIKSFCQPF